MDESEDENTVLIQENKLAIQQLLYYVEWENALLWQPGVRLTENHHNKESTMWTSKENDIIFFYLPSWILPSITVMAEAYSSCPVNTRLWP